jgi:hypothetical protein
MEDLAVQKFLFLFYACNYHSHNCEFVAEQFLKSEPQISYIVQSTEARIRSYMPDYFGKYVMPVLTFSTGKPVEFVLSNHSKLKIGKDLVACSIQFSFP